MLNVLKSFCKTECKYIFFYTLLLYCPEYRANPFGLAIALWQSIPFYLAIAVTICLVGRGIKRLFGRLWGGVFRKGFHGVMHVIVYVFSFVDFYLLNAFGLRYSSTEFELLVGTNAKESKEFITQYIGSSTFLMCLGVYVVLALVEKRGMYFCKLLKYNILPPPTYIRPVSIQTPQILRTFAVRLARMRGRAILACRSVFVVQNDLARE